MAKNTVVPIRSQQSDIDPLTEVLRQGARKLLAEAVEAEVAAFLAEYENERDEQGRQRVVRNGYLPEREIQTGLGGVAVRVPRVRDRAAAGEDALQFRSKLVPPYLRRAKNVEELLPGCTCEGSRRAASPTPYLPSSDPMHPASRPRQSAG